ncbi:transposase [Paenibacillus sp. GCM10027626]|uniref:transposase n=1 Tax=Paenibacillus sp. GCM10027626 TaxID=3273411 RepID=UPI00362C5881
MASTLSFEQFSQIYSSEQTCCASLYSAKWPNGYRCPRCSHHIASTIHTRRLPLYECQACRYQASLICGTVMEGSRTPLPKWFQALFLISSEGTGINAVKLAKIIKVTYKTAWLILHKLRGAMSAYDQRQLLEGIIHVNTAKYGKPHNPTIFRHPQEHPILGGAAINMRGDIQYMKLKQIADHFLSNAHVLPAGVEYFKQEHVAPQPADFICYTGRRPGFLFQPLIAHCKRACRWLNDTFCGIGAKHLQAYLNEYCFRVNHLIQNKSPFEGLFHSCIATKVTTYRALVQKSPQSAAIATRPMTVASALKLFCKQRFA